MVAVDVGTGKNPVSVSAGRWHTCVLLDDLSIKCFGVNTSDDLGAGQLGLGDSDNRGISLATTGDGLETVELGTGRVASHLFSAFDHNCVIFADATMKWCVKNASPAYVFSSSCILCVCSIRDCITLNAIRRLPCLTTASAGVHALFCLLWLFWFALLMWGV